MTPAQLQDAVQNAWVVFEMFRRWKFEPEEIYVCTDARLLVGVRRGGKQFFVHIIDTGGYDPKAIADAFTAFCAGIETNPDIEKIWNLSPIRAEGVNLIAALVQAGMYP